MLGLVEITALILGKEEQCVCYVPISDAKVFVALNCMCVCVPMCLQIPWVDISMQYNNEVHATTPTFLHPPTIIAE